MLKSENRLRQYKDFKEMRTKGKNVYSPLFNLKFIATNEEESKFAIVVSKKVSKKAVVRNKIKRQIREIIRLELRDKRIKNNFNVVIYTKRLIAEKEYKELEQEIHYILKKARILN